MDNYNLEVFSLNDLLKRFLNDTDIGLKAISKCTDISIFEMENLLTNSEYKIDTYKCTFLMLVLDQLINNKPLGKEDNYIKGIIKSLECYLFVSNDAVARYAEISPERLKEYVNDKDVLTLEEKYRLAISVLHIFINLIRNPEA